MCSSYRWCWAPTLVLPTLVPETGSSTSQLWSQRPAHRPNSGPRDRLIDPTNSGPRDRLIDPTNSGPRDRLIERPNSGPRDRLIERDQHWSQRPAHRALCPDRPQTVAVLDAEGAVQRARPHGVDGDAVRLSLLVPRDQARARGRRHLLASRPRRSTRRSRTSPGRCCWCLYFETRVSLKPRAASSAMTPRGPGKCPAPTAMKASPCSRIFSSPGIQRALRL